MSSYKVGDSYLGRISKGYVLDIAINDDTTIYYCSHWDKHLYDYQFTRKTSSARKVGIKNPPKCLLLLIFNHDFDVENICKKFQAVV